MIHRFKLFSMGVMLMITGLTEARLISHGQETLHSFETYEAQLEKIKNPTLPIEQEKALLKEVLTFDLGRFLIQNKGLDGYWTSYIIIHGPKVDSLGDLERWILMRAPAVRATRERFFIFQKLLQKNLKSSMTLASLPCGAMDDLLLLDYTGVEDCHLVGLDLDAQSLDLAQNNARKKGIDHVSFKKTDAWSLEAKEAFDVITSNGLNIYEPSDDKVVALYTNFYNALKPGGLLITSFLTPPPALSAESTWKNYDPSDALKQKALFADVLQVGWQSFRTEAQTRDQLEKAGFEDIQFFYDSQGIFPTVMARKTLYHRAIPEK